MRGALLAAAVAVAVAGCGTTLRGRAHEDMAAAESARAASMEDIMRGIVAADYAGDRAALEALFAQAEPFTADAGVASRAHYWRGFAKWRRAMNGANETPTPTDLAADSATAAEEFRISAELEPAFTDARVGELGCLGLMFFFDPSRAQDAALVDRLRARMVDLRTNAQDNPRYVWVWGMSYFNAPAERGGGPDNVIAAYHRALEAMGSGAGAPKGPLDPAWGEAELHVNLAYSHLNKPAPDLALARRHVEEAIRLQPTWHYARDILRAQVAAAESAAGE